MKGVQLTKLAQELNLTNLTPDIDLTDNLCEDSRNKSSGFAAYRIPGAFCKRACSDHRICRVYLSDAVK